MHVLFLQLHCRKSHVDLTPKETRDANSRAHALEIISAEMFVPFLSQIWPIIIFWVAISICGNFKFSVFFGGGGYLISNYTVHQQIIGFTSYLMKKNDFLFLGLSNMPQHSIGFKI